FNHPQTVKYREAKFQHGHIRLDLGIFRQASLPLLASPTTSMSGWAVSSDFRPSRTMRWLSARNRRIFFVSFVSSRLVFMVFIVSPSLVSAHSPPDKTRALLTPSVRRLPKNAATPQRFPPQDCSPLPI